jgi:thioesterase DpgC
MSAILISELLAHPRFGQELVDLMRRPSGAAAAHLSEFLRCDQLELPGARLSRQGPVATLEVSSPWTLNAEDESVLAALEACVDVALLDERVQIGVLRGAPVLNRKYLERRVFCSGLNLTALYEGRLPYRYYLQRELGLVNKLYRGVVSTSDEADREKPWIAGVDVHAIGGGCQLLLVMDHVVAAQGSVVSLPAGKEGILPGAASLRLPRMVGERCARRALMLDEPLLDETVSMSPLVDQIVPPEGISKAIASVADAWVEAGAVSLVSHRKALRLVQEPADQFRSYMSYFAIAQADCHFGMALVRNLERNWASRNGRQQPSTAAVAAPAGSND